MSIRVLYFAALREALGRGGELLEPFPFPMTVAGLRAHIAARPDGIALASCRNVRCAVNKAMVGDEAVIGDGDEVAFFPPVTGG